MSQPAGRSLQELKIELDQIPELRGSGIGYVGDGACRILRETQHTSGLKTWVLLQEQDLDDGDMLPKANEVPEPNLTIELVGAGLNCAGAVLAWAALGGEVIATPASGGASLEQESSPPAVREHEGKVRGGDGGGDSHPNN